MQLQMLYKEKVNVDLTNTINNNVLQTILQ